MKAKWARAKKIIRGRDLRARLGPGKEYVRPGYIFKADYMTESEQQMLIDLDAAEMLPADYTPEPDEITPQDTATIAALKNGKQAAAKPASKPDTD